MTRKALNSASMHRNASRSLRNQAMERRGMGPGEGEAEAEGTRSERWSATCFWKSSRCSSSCSWLMSMETT